MNELPPEHPLPVDPERATTSEPGADHPVHLVVTDDLRRSRLTVFFRLILAIPHLFWALVWGLAVLFVVIIAWFAALIKGRVPDGMHNFLARYLIYTTRLTGYTNLLANPYPPFHGRPGVSYPIDLHVDPPQPQARWTILLRLLLGIPAMILAYVFQQVLGIIAFISWFVCLFSGRMPKGLRDLGAYCLRYRQQTYGYLMFVTKRYPSLAGPTP